MVLPPPPPPPPPPPQTLPPPPPPHPIEFCWVLSPGAPRPPSHRVFGVLSSGNPTPHPPRPTFTLSFFFFVCVCAFPWSPLHIEFLECFPLERVREGGGGGVGMEPVDSFQVFFECLPAALSYDPGEIAAFTHFLANSTVGVVGSELSSDQFIQRIARAFSPLSIKNDQKNKHHGRFFIHSRQDLTDRLLIIYWLLGLFIGLSSYDFFKFCCCCCVCVFQVIIPKPICPQHFLGRKGYASLLHARVFLLLFFKVKTVAFSSYVWNFLR